jgi:hypothetical protein|tara:strand:- start:207 stop:635 length:429 start_codon:yes stop_codon:yes gene_type:complete
MIKQLIKKLFSENITKEKIECAIDETVVECEGEAFTNDALNYYAPYTGVPAPVLTPHDDWFSNENPVVTEIQKDYMEQETALKKEEALKSQSKEPENIHQVMYEMATKNQSTTLHIDPPGGSENYQEGKNEWNSGTGMGQFQ